MEIERKFLLKNDRWKDAVTSSAEITQFYLSTPEQVPTFRLRIKDQSAYLTIKYPSTSETVLSRPEYEYEIPLSDVTEQLENAKGKIIKKTRHTVTDTYGQNWEIDEFQSPNSNLTLAEIELTSHDQDIQLPEWLGPEVTSDKRYSNAVMAFEN